MKTISTNQAKVHFDYYVHMTIMELGSINNTKILSSKFCISIVFIFSGDLQRSQEKLETILMQNVGGTNKEYYGIFDSA